MPVYEEKNKKKWTKDGRKYYFKTYYTNKYGNRVQYQSKMFASKPKAKDAERRFLNSVEDRSFNENEDIMFVDVIDEWLLYKERLVKPTTFYCSEKRVRKYIYPYFKKYKLLSVNQRDINTFIGNVSNLPFQVKYKNKIITELREILIYAVKNYNFDSKLVEKVIKFRNDDIVKTKNDSEINYWTPEEFKKFIEVVDDDYYKLIDIFLYFTGLRFGEMRALTWNDIDFNKKTLTINKMLTSQIGKAKKIAGKSYAILSPKTKNSVRTIDLDDNLTELLYKHYMSEKELYGFNNNMFIFGNLSPIGKTTFVRQLNSDIEKAQVKKISPHGFRHSHVSLLIHLGLDSLDVAERIGDTKGMVENTYYHMFPEKKSNTVKALNNFDFKK